MPGLPAHCGQTWVPLQVTVCHTLFVSVLLTYVVKCRAVVVETDWKELTVHMRALFCNYNGRQKRCVYIHILTSSFILEKHIIK